MIDFKYLDFEQSIIKWNNQCFFSPFIDWEKEENKNKLSWCDRRVFPDKKFWKQLTRKAMCRTTQTKCCPNCGSPKTIKGGKTAFGKQKYICNNCGRKYT